MKNLKKLRTDKGLSQMNLALDLGLSQSTYQQYEADIHEAGYDVLCQLADYFQVSVDYLLDRTDISVSVAEADLKIATRIRQLGNPLFTEAVLAMLEQVESMVERESV